MSIVTKQGDQGRTRLLSGEEAVKCDLRIEAFGTLDELTAVLGFARSLIRDASIQSKIRSLQMDLFRLGSELAVSDPKTHAWVEPTSEEHVSHIESYIREIEAVIALPRSFVIPGACEAGAALDVARTIARRFERRLVELSHKGGYNNMQGLIYANRLSDYIFLLARAVEMVMGIPHDTKE